MSGRCDICPLNFVNAPQAVILRSWERLAVHPDRLKRVEQFVQQPPTAAVTPEQQDIKAIAGCFLHKYVEYDCPLEVANAGAAVQQERLF